MKKEYDFSNGVRGKFHHPDAELYLPVSIEAGMMDVRNSHIEKTQKEVIKEKFRRCSDNKEPDNKP